MIDRDLVNQLSDDFWLFVLKSRGLEFFQARTGEGR